MLISRQSIILELGPLLTGLVLTGRVGARITAEIDDRREHVLRAALRRFRDAFACFTPSAAVRFSASRIVSWNVPARAAVAVASAWDTWSRAACRSASSGRGRNTACRWRSRCCPRR